ncbi:MAG: sigma-54 dependent transcriptional regulator [Bacteroidetes bacterium]|nr:sigma-54 dependent transcriptional regulator [Bacteroidota bacterium]
MLNLLIIDDSVPFLNDVELLLKDKYNIFKAENGKKGLKILKRENISLVLLDLKLPDIYGLDVLQQIHNEIDQYMPVIIITDYGNLETAVKAMQLGAFDFVQKDFNHEILNQKIIIALERRELNISLNVLKETVNEQYDYFISASIAMQALDFEITKYAKQDIDVLIQGETGVGKDIIAYEIHKRSKRENKIFVQVPLHTLSENLIESELFGYEKGAFSGADSAKTGKFEAANGGTIYLPEISEINENLQLKLLYFMQYKSINKIGQGSSKNINLDVKVIMASNKNLTELVEKGKLREDFYYRISAVTLTVPPLRNRKDGLKELAEYFLTNLSAKYHKTGLQLPEEVIEAMMEYNWPGNVRELRNAIQRAVIMADNDKILSLDDFPNLIASSNQYNNGGDGSFQAAMNKAKYDYFKSLLAETSGNKTKAAERAGLSRQGLLNILKDLDFE